MNPPHSTFFVTGGTLRADAPSYVERQADRDILDGLLHGDFCYVLTSRQMGKSSLMVRTACRLRELNVHVAALDLTAIGQNLKPDQWYDGLLLRLGRQINLELELESFWESNHRLGPCQRFFTALRDVVLPRLINSSTLPCPNVTPPSDPLPPISHTTPSLVIFVDEIDTVRSLPFSTDEFFAAIRECYNRRSQDPEFARLTFCLLGVATPTDLISNPKTTPFNIGRRIELNDFVEDEALPLAAGLHAVSRMAGASDRAAPRRVLKRILYWTGGHPYLTQRLCHAAAAAATDTRWVLGCEEYIDQRCNELFLSSRARERDDNLIFVRERLLRANTDVPALLELYQRIHAGKPVPDDPANPLIAVLRLAGITRVSDGILDVRNRIYRHVFDRSWAATNMPGAEVRRQRRAFRHGLLRGLALAFLALVIATSGIILYRRAERAERIQNTIRNLGAAYQGIHSYQDTAEVQIEMEMDGAGLTANGHCTLAFDAPNRFNLHLQLRFGLMETDVRLVSNGTNAWIHLPAVNQYLLTKAPNSIAELVANGDLSGLLVAPLSLYSAIASPDPSKALTSSITSPIRLLQQQDWEGLPACLLTFEQPAAPNPDTSSNPSLPPPTSNRITTRLWVTPDDGMIRQISMDLSAVVQRALIPHLSGGAPREVPIHSYVMSSRHRQIRLNQPIPPDTFEFNPPPNTQGITSIDTATLFAAGRSTDTEPLFNQDNLKQLIPPRPPEAGPDQIDLSPHYNAPLTKPWHSALDRNDLSLLPNGLQSFANVLFDVRGVVQLSGTAEPYLRRMYPEVVRDISIHRTFDQLHFLHAAGWNTPDGTQIASFIVHYTDGAQRIIPIVYGYHVRNWWPQPNEPPDDVTGLVQAWHTPNTPGAPRRLYLTTWINPRPSVPVATLDYVSALATAAPFLVAITAQNLPP